MKGGALQDRVKLERGDTRPVPFGLVTSASSKADSPFVFPNDARGHLTSFEGAEDPRGQAGCPSCGRYGRMTDGAGRRPDGSTTSNDGTSCVCGPGQYFRERDGEPQ